MFTQKIGWNKLKQNIIGFKSGALDNRQPTVSSAKTDVSQIFMNFISVPIEFLTVSIEK